VPYQPTERPIPGPEAFREAGDAAALSRAAILLLLRAQLREDGQAERALAEDEPSFPVPRLQRSGERIPVEPVRERLARRYAGELREDSSPEEMSGILSERLPDLAARLYEKPGLLAAAELFETCLFHPDELTRVAAAAANLELSSDPVPSLELLRRGAQSADELVRDVSATALAQVAPEDPGLAKLTAENRLPSGAPARTALLVHGTFARPFAWWQPGGGFHAYLSGIRPDLYAASDRFDWSGMYSDIARALGAIDLHAWIRDHGLDGLDLFAHSHGGSVAMLASNSGLDIGKLVLLSCPAHPQKYMPDFQHVGKVVSVRVHLDLVILVDGGGQRFAHPRISENVLPVWFHHSATHDPDVWRKHDIPAKL
jgi:hypothetical protein